MPVLGRARSRVALIVLLAVLCSIGSLTAPTASAGPPEGVVGSVTETVGEPVGEVVETVTPPLEETTEAASGAVQEVTETPPPVGEVTEAATAPAGKIAKEVTPPVKAAAETLPRPPASTQISGAVRGAVSAAGANATAKTGGVKRTTKVAIEDVTGAATPAPQSARPPGSDSTGPAPEKTAGRDAAPSSPEATARAPGATFVPSPSKTGATAAPLPKWVSYIWPAIALLRPDLVNLLERSAPAMRLVLGASDGFEGEGAVAGVHATGGRFGPSDSSSTASPSSPSSPFSKITSAVGQFPYNVSGAVLGYILIVAIMLIGLFVAIRWEIANGRREGRG
jgi:hypothetical protein